MMTRGFAVIVLFLLVAAKTLCGERAQIIVAQDGSGTCRTIQEALNSVPKDNATNVTILIRKGTYNEKIFIVQSHVILVGEDRDSTRIVYAELRENWTKAHDGKDWGSGVVNIDSTANDVILANLTIYNNYGSLHHTSSHQFAVRGNGTRVMILSCNVIADGNDTVSLWNRDNGLYYHANCNFEGWVDYVCPRGWCYITDSRFYGHNLNASIWHDGRADKTQKFVIRYSYFDGVPNFPLGRHHRDAQIFLLDCIFSRTMADRQIYLPVSPNAEVWKWGPRHYYFNCHREGGDYAWFADNLKEAEGSPSASQIDAKWTFGGRWDPEGTMPSVLPFVSQPVPRDGAYGIPTEQVNISWVPSRNADASIAYFSKESNPERVAIQSVRSFRLGALEPHTRYFWRIDEVVGADTIKGPLWHFTTK
ncbi:MAG TPA: pectinesterase family protein [Bacteroidota bacterium]|nr:pectinesterase family protein [Bacteroidota bacterium]